MPDVDAALAKVVDPGRRGGPCWAKKLETEEQRQFLSRLEELHAAVPHKVNQSHAARVMTQDFGFYVSNRSMQIHLSGRCSCDK